MRIGIITSTRGLSWGVTDEVWYRMALRALEAGHKLFVAGEGQLVASEKMASLAKCGVGACARRPFRPTRLYHLKERICPDFRALLRFRPHVVLFSGGSLYDPLYQPSLGMFCRRLRCPLVYLGHAHAELFATPNRAELEAFYAGLAGMVFVSEGNRTLLATQFGREFCPCWVVRNVPLIMPELLPVPLSATVRFACLARLDLPIKGHDVLFAALASTTWANRDWHLDLCGEGPDAPTIRKLVSAHGLDQRVSLRGQVGDIRSLWCDTHALLLASRGEGLANVVLETMSFGRVPVTTAVGGHAEVITDGVDGFIAEAPTLPSFQSALERAWAARDRWPSMGKVAHQRMQHLLAEDREGQLLEVLTKSVRDHSIGDHG